jgi:hypothetical protein
MIRSLRGTRGAGRHKDKSCDHDLRATEDRVHVQARPPQAVEHVEGDRHLSSHGSPQGVTALAEAYAG